MKHVIRAIILIIILYVLAERYRYDDSVYNIISVLATIAFLYLLVAVIGTIVKSVRQRKSGAPAVEPPARNKAGCSLFLLMLVIAAVVYYYRTTVGSYSFKAFLFLDTWLKLSENMSPLIVWGIVGLLAGSIFGSLVAWKKYKLHAAVNLIPIGIFVVFLALLYIINQPLSEEAYEVPRNMQRAVAYEMVTASEYNSVKDRNATYKPAFLLDNNEQTAWITESTGGKEEVRFSFGTMQNFAGKHLQCVGFTIKNGYRKSPQLWNNFARAKEITIRHNGRLIATVPVADLDTGSEELPVETVPISSFDNMSITVASVYPGEKYATRVAISELVPVIEYEQE